MQPVPSGAWKCPVCDVASLERDDILSHIAADHGPRSLRKELGLPWTYRGGQFWMPGGRGPDDFDLLPPSHLFQAAKFLNLAYPIIDRILENAPADEEEHIQLRRAMDEVFPK